MRRWGNERVRGERVGRVRGGERWERERGARVREWGQGGERVRGCGECGGSGVRRCAGGAGDAGEGGRVRR